MSHRLPAPALVPALALVTLLAACGGQGDETIDTVFDPCEPLAVVPLEGATMAERESVAAALELWRTLAGARLTLERVEADQVVPVRFEEAAPFAFGLYDDERGEIFVNRLIEDPRERTLTVAHELGHAFGLVHVEPDERVSLMNPGRVTCEPTEADVAALVALWGACDAI